MVQTVKLKDVLKQYRITHWVENDTTYKQVTISQTGEVSFRGEKEGINIGRKRQFLIDLDKYPDTLIFIRQGVFKGGIGIASKEVNGGLVTENMPMFNIVNIEPEYLSFFLKSPQFVNAVNTLVPLGTAQKAIHERQLLELEMPLPSKEQQRKCIMKLNNMSNNKSTVSNNITRNLDYISKLRQSILQEAVSGKLVPQNPKDESASELLKKIKAEKEKLIREKKIKKDKPLLPITEEEIPYGLPKGWVWVKLGEIGNAVESAIVDGPFGSSIDVRKDYIPEGVPIIRMLNIKPYTFIKENLKFISKEKYLELERHNILPLDVLFSKVGAGIGETCIVPDNFKFGLLSTTGLARFRVGAIVLPKYLCYFLNSSKQYLIDLASTTAQPFLNMGTIKRVLFPLPPLPEQKRIVEKVDQLMKLCDELEEKVKENQKNSELLMEAVLREAFEA